MYQYEPKTKVKQAFFYFHTAKRDGSEINPFVEKLIQRLPDTYIWAGDGFISGSALMGSNLAFNGEGERFWFNFPAQEDDKYATDFFQRNVTAMGAVLTCCGVYINAFIDEKLKQLGLCAKDAVLCGYRHGSCAALAAAMVRKNDPFPLSILLNPFPLEMYYLRIENNLPSTKVLCVDTEFTRTEQMRISGDEATDQLFRQYGINAELVLSNDTQDPLGDLFGTAIDYIGNQYTKTGD